MSPVEMSSPTTTATRPSIVSGTGRPGGGETMLAPRVTSSSRASAAGGGRTICASTRPGSPVAGASAGGVPSVRGSVISPCSAVAAAVAGEQR